MSENFYPGESARKKSIISLVCGIGSIALDWGPFIGIILAVVGIILSNKATAQGDTSGFCKAGKITSIIGLILGIISVIIWICFIIYLVFMAPTIIEESAELASEASSYIAAS